MKKLIIIIGVLSSCVYDPPKPKIAIVKNLSNAEIGLFYVVDSLTVNQLHYLTPYFINADSIGNIYGPYPIGSGDGKVRFYLFNSDSLNINRNNMAMGVYSRSFLTEYIIEENKLSNLDTIFYPVK